MPMRMTYYVSLMGTLVLAGLLLSAGGMATGTELTPEGKPEPSRPKDPDVKPKEPDPKPKDADSKPAEQKPKEADVKPKESETKSKEPESKPKDSEPKTKEPPVKTKESEHKAKESEKVKETEQKSKDSEPKSKESEVVPENPCPAVAHAPETKAAPETSVAPADNTAGERPKAVEPEPKKPIRSSMVTAKLALMGDPRLFPYEIEVDAKDKDLVLLGKVSQESDKKAATDIVRCLEGVHAVENRLKVESDATHSLVSERDKVLTQLVKERFEKSKTLQSVKFDVKTEDGIVTLSGNTRFQIIVLEAAQAARQVPGVRAVNTDAVRLVGGE
ncbi:MAG: BON domain-containing protein [Nitrospira sp.]|nr:BON domain-containing protein [Nitrospira sp.]